MNIAVYEVRQAITNCMDCPNKKVVDDPDPHDSFNRDDEAVLCTKTVNDKGSKYYAYGIVYEHKPVTVSCRPYRKRDECDVPDWCPLIRK